MRERGEIQELPVGGVVIFGENGVMIRSENDFPADVRRYTVVQDGGSKYLTDDKGNRVSQGYQTFEFFHYKKADGTERGLLIGAEGSERRVLRSTMPFDSHITQYRHHFGTIEYRPDLLNGVILIGDGSQHQIVDDNFEPRSAPYFDFVMRRGNHFGPRRLYGVTGSADAGMRFQEIHFDQTK